VEFADPRGELLPLAAREEATRRARERGGEVAGERALASAIEGRAQELLARLARDEPLVARIAGGVPAGLLALLALAPAVVYSLGRSVLGPGREIDIFRNPLLALVLWNLLVALVALAAALARALRPRPTASPAGNAGPRASPATRPPLLASRLGEWLLLLGLSRGALRAAERAEIRRRAVGEFASRWRRIAALPLAIDARLLLHSAALLLLASAVGEAYLRGLFTEYTVTRESTLLSPDQLGSIAWAIYGLPARLLALDGLPPHAPGAPAAPWIHLLSLSALLYGALPRAILLAATLRARRRVRVLLVPIAPSLARRIGAAAATGFARARVIPCATQLPAGGVDRLRALLGDLLGASAVIDWEPMLPYGAPWPTDIAAGRSEGDDGELCRVAIFSLAQTPESEVHGALARSLAGGGAPGIAIVEGSGLARRFGGDAEGRARLEERRRAWDRVLDEAGLVAAHLDLSREADDEAYASLARSLAAARRDGARR